MKAHGPIPTGTMVLVLLAAVTAGPLLAANPDPPASPVKLIFIHHSTGENWLADGNGGLGIALRDANYFVSDTNYGWGPDGIGDNTDLGHWWLWFAGPDRDTYMSAVYTEYAQHPPGYYSRLADDPGGENQIVMFKSCFPNSNLGGATTDPPVLGYNPLRADGYWSAYHRVGYAKAIYKDILAYFRTRQDKLFVVIAAPPLASSTPEAAANARAFNEWLVNEWLADYPYPNVAVFDFYNVLTSNGGNANTNDLGSETGNHHRWWDGAVQHLQTVANNALSYPTGGDSHPSQAGNLKATGEYVQVLNTFYHAWHDGRMIPEQLHVEETPVLAPGASANGILEPGETAMVGPVWTNLTAGTVALTGTASNLTGPTPADYSMPDTTASYGTVAAGGTGDCTEQGPSCYEVTVAAPSGRPAVHWDATFVETLSHGEARAWTLHVGSSFTDVPESNVFYRHVETLFHNQVTLGTAATEYGPIDGVPRYQMAMFISRAMAGSDELVPTEGSVEGRGDYFCAEDGVSLFEDVQPTDLACRHIHAVAAVGAALGCTAEDFCTTGMVNRAEMAMFIARAVAGSDDAVPQEYTDAATSRSYSCNPDTPNIHFSDVPLGSVYCNHAHYLWALGIVDGCYADPPVYLYCSANGVNRQEMSKFLVNAFDLQLYGR